MSINQLDLQFPDISGKSPQEALQVILNYLYMLIEQLRYTLYNLGAENFNEAEWAQMQNGILKIVADNYVTFESLKTPGKVIIDGGNLKADGTIEGQNIRGGTIGIGGEGNNYNFFVDPEGNVTLNGDITWGAGASPVKVQYSVNGTSGWHDTFSANDKFARYSYDGGQTWTQAFKIVGDDGRNGSDANVPAWVAAYTSSAQFNTYVNNQWVVAMNLYGSKIFGADYYAEDAQTSMDLLSKNDLAYGIGGGLILRDTSYQLFSATRKAQLSTELRGFQGNHFMTITANGVLPLGNWDFSAANVNGLNVTAVFG